MYTYRCTSINYLDRPEALEQAIVDRSDMSFEICSLPCHYKKRDLERQIMIFHIQFLTSIHDETIFVVL